MEDSILNFINGEISKYIIPDIQRLDAPSISKNGWNS